VPREIIRRVTGLGEIRIESLRGEAARAIRLAILNGEIRPGEIHSAPALADRLGVSVTPVREAMLSLASTGLVEAVANRGFRVVAPAQRDIDELVDLRELTEAPLLRALAGAVSARDADALSEAAQMAASAADESPAAFALAERAFDERLSQLITNTVAREVLAGYRDYARLHRLLESSSIAHRAAIALAQQQLVQMLQRGSADEIDDASRIRLAAIGAAWRDALQSG
jgi:DNA-binding GntR family transcriptional regulator